MPRENRSSNKPAANPRPRDDILRVLRETYPEAHCELVYANPLELLVATILSAQCTDKMVNRVTADLFRKYRTAADYANAAPEALESDLKRLGFFRSKARSIRRCCRALLDRHAGAVPQTMEALVQLDGVGRKTANVVLGNAFGVNAGVVVDTHVRRLAQRLGFTRQTDPVKIEADLMRWVPPSDWTLFSHWLIWHGRRRCGARRPDCAGCEVRAWCPSAGTVPRTGPPARAGVPTGRGPTDSRSPAATVRGRTRPAQKPRAAGD